METRRNIDYVCPYVHVAYVCVFSTELYERSERSEGKTPGGSIIVKELHRCLKKKEYFIFPEILFFFLLACLLGE